MKIDALFDTNMVNFKAILIKKIADLLKHNQFIQLCPHQFVYALLWFFFWFFFYSQYCTAKKVA